MKDTEILETIVVEVSRDGKNGNGTGFYISEDEVATCYHVLVSDGQKPRRNKTYWIKNDVWDGGWQKAKLVRYRPLPDDIAVLKTSRRLESFDPELIRAWNKEESDFLSRGYGEEIADGSSYADEIEGQIETETWIYKKKSRRLRLQTPSEAIKEGMSGSPVFSSRQIAIVGMIDYQGGEQQDAQIGFAIPIEAFAKDDSKGRLFWVPPLPPNFIPRSADLNLVHLGLNKSNFRCREPFLDMSI